jgi:hypothetical protein
MQPSNQQVLSNYNRKLTTPKAPRRKEDPHNGQPTEDSPLKQLLKIFLLRLASFFYPR